MTADLETVVRGLAGASRRAWGDALDAVDWPATLDPAGGWCTSPELVSLAGTPRWAELPPEQQRALSFWEAVNFFSLSVWGERALLAGVAARLRAPGLEAVSGYLHHLLDEENRHSAWFATFCLRYGGRLYPDRAVALADEDPADHLRFFGRLVVFEELVDRFNRTMAADDRLAPVVRRIHALHHDDERRHLAFGRRLVADLWREGAAGLDPDALGSLRAHLVGFATATCRSLCPTEAYRDAGLADPVGAARLAWAHRRQPVLVAACLRPLVAAGILGAAS